jgi:hypothetical protein
VSTFSEMKGLWQTMGTIRFMLFFGGVAGLIIGYVAIQEWIAGKVGWPDAYDFHCRGKECSVVELYNSYKLLENVTYYELLLFAWLWLIPASSAMAIIVVLTRRWIQRRKNRIRPLR